MSETHDPWKDVTWFVACQHCGATTTRGNLTFSGGLHCARCDDITEMPQEVAYRANIDAARAAEATQHRQEIAAKDETIDGLRLVALGWEKQRDEARARLAAVEAERDRLKAVMEQFVAAYQMALRSTEGNERPAILAMKAAYCACRAALSGEGTKP